MALAGFVSECAEAAGYPRLARAGKSTLWRILNEQPLKPHQVRYDLERRGPDFDRKREEVLIVYRDVGIYKADAVHDGRPAPIYTVSVDEKPGVQALAVTAPDLPPEPGKAETVSRDYEDVRHGTSPFWPASISTRVIFLTMSKIGTAASSSLGCLRK